METKLSEHDLALALSDVLDRVRRGERFVVERGGLQLAVLSPPAQEDSRGITGLELVSRLGDLRMPGDGFADDIESARAVLLPTPSLQWPE